MTARNDIRASTTYAAPVDAQVAAAYEALLRIDPMASFAARLSALGVDDRVVWADSPVATGLTDTDGRRELGFSLVWRFGPPGQTARIRWRISLGTDGSGRTMLRVQVRASAADEEAGRRIASAWSIVETIALEHAKVLRNAVDALTEDPPAAREPLRLSVVSVAA